MEIQEKILREIDTECRYAEKNGTSRFSTCDHYNWDSDIWNNRQQIITGIRDRGYNVSQSTNWGVLDIITTKKQ